MPEPIDSRKPDALPLRRRDSRTAQPAQPLTRRQLREREEAEAEAEAQSQAAAKAASRAKNVPDAAPVIVPDAEPAPELVPETEPELAPEPEPEPEEPAAAPSETSAPLTRRALREQQDAVREQQVWNVETVPLEIELVAQHPVFEIETAEHIAAETVLSAEADFAKPHGAPEPGSAIATTRTEAASDATPRRVPVPYSRVRRSVPVAELLSSSSGTFVSHARFQPIKRRILAGFVMTIATLFVISLSIPTFGLGMTSDFASLQTTADVSDSQNLSVGEGPALAAARDDFYAVGAPGSLYSTTNTVVSREAQKLATELMAAVAAGKLKGSIPNHIPEIQALADGVVKPDCGIDLRILQVMVIAVRNFDSVAVSDINRKCTNQIEGAGTGSSHYTNGGGHAVDFYLLNGSSLPGADANTIRLAKILDPVMPPGSDLGQSECRAAAGVQLSLTNLKEFPDSCTHMHVDVGNATQGLNVDLDAPGSLGTPIGTTIPAK
ncbi:hypothetical protein [Agreia sp. COWG]|uniref:hypothetical protein n=1 Tax=Agreia sp. COWG TaxID=2773266 RepID=UPI0019253B4D|nr:hypothetical protein [Agreia sp. COWG]CAD6003498.1 conserved protein of unknown function [Agreia sp. COWG]